jgi:branched-chain amino acid transport system permease protein
MTTITARPQQSSNWKAQLNRPWIALAVGLAYVICAIILAQLVGRSSLWYPLANMIAVPIFFIAPLVVVSLNITRWLKIALLVIMLGLIMPIIGVANPTYLEIAIQVSIFAGLALGLNIVVGFAGLLDLGYVAFFAVGAYLWAVFTSPVDTVFMINGWTLPGEAFFIMIAVGVFGAAFVGILLGLPVLRLRGDYLAIVTLGFGEVVRMLVRNLDSPINFTNGAQGLYGVSSPPLPGFSIGFTTTIASALSVRVDNPVAIAGQLMFYVIAIVTLLVIILVCSRLKDSPIGRAWTAIREDEVAAIAMGVPLVRMKLLAFASGAAFAGAIGVIYASKQTFIDPESFVLLQSISILAMVIVGGMGNIKGVILGAMIITIVDISTLSNLSLQFNNLRNSGMLDIPPALEPAKYQPLVFGLILVLMMLFRPAGLLPEKSRKLELQAETEDPLEFATEEPLEDAVLADTSTPEEK